MGNRSLRRFLPCPRFLQLERTVFAKLEEPDQRRQAQPLQDERGQDHREGHEDDLAAEGKRRARRRRLRQGERGGERDDAAHSDPRQQQHQRPRRDRIARAQRAAHESGDHDRQRDPDQTDHDDGKTDEGPEAHEGPEIDVDARRADGAELEPDQREDHAVQDEDEDIPDGEGLHARGGRHRRAEVPSHVKAAGYAREHARGVRALGQEPGRIGCQQGDSRLGQAVLGEAQRPADEPAHDQPDQHAARRGQDELPQRRREREDTRHDRRDRGPIEHERRGVVDQALALEDGHDPIGDAQASGDGTGGDGVGRRDDGAEGDRRRPAQPGHDEARDGGDHRGRGQHQPDREQRDRTQIGPEVAERGEVRRGKQDGRQKDQEHQIGVETDDRDVRDETDDQPAEDQEDGIGDQNAAGGRRERQHGREQRDDDLELMRVVHRLSLSSPVRKALADERRELRPTAGGSGPGGDVTASSKLGEGQARVHHAALVGQLVQVAVLSPRRAAQRRGRTAFANFS